MNTHPVVFHCRCKTFTCDTGPAESFHYTSQGGRVALDDVDDQSEFTFTRDAMKLLGFHDDQLRGVFQVLSAVLHLGNVEVGRRSKGGDVMGEVGEGNESLVTSATLLGVDSTHLAHWLCHKKITTAREVYHKPLTHPQVCITYRGTTLSNGSQTSR